MSYREFIQKVLAAVEQHTGTKANQQQALGLYNQPAGRYRGPDKLRDWIKALVQAKLLEKETAEKLAAEAAEPAGQYEKQARFLE